MKVAIRTHTHNSGTRLLLWGAALLAVLCCGFVTPAEAACPLPYNLLNGVIYDAVQVMADLNALANCTGTGGGGGGGITRISEGPGITLTPNPITSIGTVGVNACSTPGNTGTGDSELKWDGSVFSCPTDIADLDVAQFWVKRQ